MGRIRPVMQASLPCFGKVTAFCLLLIALWLVLAYGPPPQNLLQTATAVGICGRWNKKCGLRTPCPRRSAPIGAFENACRTSRLVARAAITRLPRSSIYAEIRADRYASLMRLCCYIEPGLKAKCRVVREANDRAFPLVRK